MIEIRIHGRGGQGVVTAAELIAMAAFYEGFEAQAFPNFGVERRGAPIEAYARISDKPIKLRSQIYEPDIIVVQDDSLLSVVDVFKGIKKDTKVIINSDKKLEDIFKTGCPVPTKNIATISATKIALEILGKPIINTVMLGFFAKFSGLIKAESINKALKDKFKGEILKKNIRAVEYAYEI
ncbi:pyruvate ferredoxin oxidoreductase subunit gamma [Candidatus Falkowbacteria bacterium]|jgi:2-oxoacid:acceptor oxidoreductase gamma subunit (pyruvate/2-ketoisovalerate family)|nr:pyruvate ferredoxin oxidoreductase subunit gamma [Candidatus Falkowbacteria bacterium]MBT4439404.1 pyruvate ferredoxin oxidoreductase subunit gamma [Elusimicrobiaceae bacterium]